MAAPTVFPLFVIWVMVKSANGAGVVRERGQKSPKAAAANSTIVIKPPVAKPNLCRRATAVTAELPDSAPPEATEGASEVEGTVAEDPEAASELIPAMGTPLELASRFSRCKSARRSDACW